jgi:hypothetical protein
LESRVARWQIFKTKIPIWVNLGGPYKGRCLVYYLFVWSILRLFGIFCGHLVYLMVFGIYFPGMLYQEKSGNPVGQRERERKERKISRLGSNLERFKSVKETATNFIVSHFIAISKVSTSEF